MSNNAFRGGEEIGEALLNIEAANSQSQVSLFGNSQLAAGNGGCLIERSRINSIGNYCQSPRVQTSDSAAEMEHALRHADGAGRKKSRKAIKYPVPSLLVLGNSQAADNPGPPRPGSCQSGRQIRMEQEGLHKFGPALAQHSGQSYHDLHGPAWGAGQALTWKASLTNSFGETSFCSERNDRRRPAAAV